MKNLKNLFTICLLLLSIFSLSTTYAQESSRSNKNAMVIFLENLNSFSIRNNDNVESAEFPALLIFSNAILKASEVSAVCDYRGRGLLEDCLVSVSFESKERIGIELVSSITFKYTIVNDQVMDNSLQVYSTK